MDIALIELVKVVILGIVEGLTEWLPVSSTGHMILVDEFIKLDVSKSFMDMFLVVIQLGAGIDARYDRLGRPAVTHWYDLDLPEAIELRRRLLPESERNTYLAMSLLDFRWIDTVRAHGRPVLLILEGVLMYFTEAEVRSFFDAICRELPDGTTVLFDMLAYWLVNNAKHHDVVKKADKTVEFKWSVLDTLEMERWNPRIHLVREYYMSDHARGRFPFVFRTLYHIPYFHRRFNQRIVRLEIR